MSQAAKVRLEDLDIKPYVIAKLKMAGIESVFDLAISIPHQLVDIGGGMLTGTDEHVALELLTKQMHTTQQSLLQLARSPGDLQPFCLYFFKMLTARIV